MEGKTTDLFKLVNNLLILEEQVVGEPNIELIMHYRYIGNIFFQSRFGNDSTKVNGELLNIGNCSMESYAFKMINNIIDAVEPYKKRKTFTIDFKLYNDFRSVIEHYKINGTEQPTVEGIEKAYANMEKLFDIYIDCLNTIVKIKKPSKAVLFFQKAFKQIGAIPWKKIGKGAVKVVITLFTVAGIIVTCTDFVEVIPKVKDWIINLFKF